MKLIPLILVLAAIILPVAKVHAATDSLVIPVGQSADEREDPEGIKEIRVQEVEALPDLLYQDASFYPLDFSLGSVIAAGDGLFTLGQKVWDIIQNGKGVSTLQLGPPLSILPQTNAEPSYAFSQMEGWSDPKVRAYRIEFRNWRNAVAVAFDYLVHFQHSGTYDGRGKYLHGVTVSGSNVTVGWLWSLDASVEHLVTANSGTKDSPVAGVRLAVNYKVVRRSIGSEYKGTHVIFVKGDGKVEKLGEEQDKAKEGELNGV